MKFVGTARLAGYRSGTKEKKDWMSLALDDVDNPMNRIQVFVPDDLQDTVADIAFGSEVTVVVNLYMRVPERGYSRLECTLLSIKQID